MPTGHAFLLSCRPFSPAFALLTSVLALPLSPTSAQAQLGLSVVKDPWNLVENAATVSNTAQTVSRLYDQLERLDLNLEKIPVRLYRDLIPQLDALLAAADRGAVTWTTPGVADLYSEYFGHNVAFTPEILEIIDARGLQKERGRGALTTLAASLAAVSVHADDYDPTLAHLRELDANARAAQGNLEALEVAAMYQDAIAHELVKLNQSLGALASAQSAAFGYQISDRSSFEATLNSLLAALADTPFPLYEGTAGHDGIPDAWPWPCFGCN